MKMSQMFPSKYLKADELGDSDHTFTISRIAIESLGQGAEKDEKPVVYFSEIEKGLVVNKTNATTITKIAGSDDTEDWIGKKVTLFATEVQFGADMVLSIRVRLPRAPAQTLKLSNPSPGLPASKESAWAAVSKANGGDRAKATVQWTELIKLHGSNWTAMIQDVNSHPVAVEAPPEDPTDLGVDENSIPF